MTLSEGRRLRLEDFGVSASTVSLVLRGLAGPSAEMRARVFEAVDRLGYRPDRPGSALASRRSRTIGVLMDITSPFHVPLVLDLDDAARSHGYRVVLSTINRTDDEAQAVEALLDSRCEALILLGPEASRQSLNRLDGRVPVLVVGRSVPSRTVDVVRSADDDAVSQAVSHLVELGHQRIDYVDGPPGTVATLTRGGYQTAMAEAGLAENIRVVEGGLNEADGIRAADSILGAGSRSTGVVAFNDRCAIGVIDALVRAGVDVPGSYRGRIRRQSGRRPAADHLTTVAQDTSALAVNAMNSLIERLDQDRQGRREVIVAPHLIIRGTTCPVSLAANGR